MFEKVQVKSAEAPDTLLKADSLMDLPTQLARPVDELTVRESVTVTVSM